MAADDPRTAFLQAAAWHGTLEPANQLLAAHPWLATSDVHTAAVLGDDEAVRRFLAADPDAARALSGPYQADPLNYLCLSRYLRLDRSRSEAFLRAATALLDAGADPNTGFWTTGQFPERETALYGAAGVAHHEALTRLLIERGADPNDDEAAYHSPEGYDLGAMRVLVETGRMTKANLAMMLLRKHDWHDYNGVKYLLEHGADPNYGWGEGVRAINHAIARDNDRAIVELLLDHGGDPTLSHRSTGLPGVVLAAQRGRGDLLSLFERRGIPVDLPGVLGLIAACARDDPSAIRDALGREPGLVEQLIARGDALLPEFAGNRNTAGVGHLLDLGVLPDALYQGDGYFDIPPESTALHVAAWRLHAPVIRVLLERGAEVNARDGRGRTPLMLAVKGCVDSYWSERRSTEPIRLLLEAGATARDIVIPTGYPAADALLG